MRLKHTTFNSAASQRAGPLIFILGHQRRQKRRAEVERIPTTRSCPDSPKVQVLAPAGHPAAERCRPSERVRAANLAWLCERVSGRSIPLLARVASTRRIAPSLIVA